MNTRTRVIFPSDQYARYFVKLVFLDVKNAHIDQSEPTTTKFKCSLNLPNSFHSNTTNHIKTMIHTVGCVQLSCVALFFFGLILSLDFALRNEYFVEEIVQN